MVTLVGLVARLQRGHIVTPRAVEPERYPWTPLTADPNPHLVMHPRHVPVLPRRNEEAHED